MTSFDLKDGHVLKVLEVQVISSKPSTSAPGISKPAPVGKNGTWTVALRSDLAATSDLAARLPPRSPAEPCGAVTSPGH